MIVYVNTKTDSSNRVVADLAATMGVGVAQGIVNKWYKEYNEFVYDEKTGDLLFFKKAYSGFWESKQENLVKYK